MYVKMHAKMYVQRAIVTTVIRMTVRQEMETVRRETETVSREATETVRREAVVTETVVLTTETVTVEDLIQTIVLALPMTVAETAETVRTVREENTVEN